MEGLVDKLIEDDIVENSNSRWNSPIILVPKKANENEAPLQYRAVLDFRKLNEVTQNMSFPVPNLLDEISKMNGAQYFTTMDLNAAFHQVPMAEEDKELTSFQTATKKLQFKRMPY